MIRKGGLALWLLLHVVTGQQRNFGVGISQGIIRTTEEAIFEHNVSANAVLTHFWITGSSYYCGDQICDGGLGQHVGHWNGYIDYVIIRYYIDHATAPSIAFSVNMACGVGPFRSRVHTLYAPPGCLNAPTVDTTGASAVCDGGSAGRTPFVPGQANQTRNINN